MNNLNEVNRRLYDENSKYQERNVEQRKQLEHFHLVILEIKKAQEQAHSELKISNERLTQYESELEMKTAQVNALQNKEKTLLDKLELVKTQCQELLDCRNVLQREVYDLRDFFNDSLTKMKKNSTSVKDAHFAEIKRLNEIACMNRIELEQVQKMAQHDKQKLEKEKVELSKHLNEIEMKLEEIIKEKAQISYENGQLNEKNHVLADLVSHKEKLAKDLEASLAKTKTIETELKDCKETHKRDTEEWKKFQADLQTAVRVANDFMNGKLISYFEKKNSNCILCKKN